MTDPNIPTARVRIAVMVDADGQFEANGSSSNSDEDVIGWLEEIFGSDSNRHTCWVVADVPLPRGIEEVEGEVADG